MGSIVFYEKKGFMRIEKKSAMGFHSSRKTTKKCFLRRIKRIYSL